MHGVLAYLCAEGLPAVLRAEPGFFHISLSMPMPEEPCVCVDAMHCHMLQDVNKEPGAEDMFKKISEAYEVGGVGTQRATAVAAVRACLLPLLQLRLYLHMPVRWQLAYSSAAACWQRP